MMRLKWEKCEKNNSRRNLLMQPVALDGIRGSVNPHFVGNAWRSRFSIGKSFRVPVIGVVEHLLSGGLHLPCQAVVYSVGREEPQTAVTVLGVIPGKERLEIDACVLGTGEASRV